MMKKAFRRICLQVTAAIFSVVLIADNGNIAASAAVISAEPDMNAKTYTISEVADNPVALVANSGAYTINGNSYKATSMQGLNVGTTYAYVAKTESATGINGNEAMTCMWRIKLSTGDKVACVFKNEGTSDYIEYSTSLGHANDVLVRKYAAGTDLEETNHIFACTLNTNKGVVRLKAAGTDSSGRPKFDFGGYYKFVTSAGAAFAPTAMRYVAEETDASSGVTYSYFVCKNAMDILACRIASTDLGGSGSDPSVVTCYRLFTIDTHNAYFADCDGEGNPGTIDQLQGWTNQGFYYDSTESAIYVPLYNSDTTMQSVILVYDVGELMNKTALVELVDSGSDLTQWMFPSMLTFNGINTVKWEIEAVGFATGTKSSYPLYFSINSTAANEGIWTFDYTRGSSTSYIRQSVLDNADGSQKTYYTVHYEANGGIQDTNVNWRKYMADTAYVRGITTQLCKNTFVREGYEFAGWNLTRASDGKTLYFVPETENGETLVKKKWYTPGQQPENATVALYKDCQKVSSLSTVDGDVVTCVAQWNDV